MDRKSGQVQVIRLQISLRDIEPEIWRIIDVPETYSFWDLHVAIQDAVGWLDYHLHAFVPEPGSADTPSIGIPGDDWDDETLPGWEMPISRYLKEVGDTMAYEYDFGDGWCHSIEVLEILPGQESRECPACVDGARACPPEDCGGVPGYYDLLEVLADPEHSEHKSIVGWLKHHAKCYYPYNPETFDPHSVEFSDPKERFRIAFEEE